ncbi:MAG: hypothetical protein AAGA87_08690, partial [Pseudomonadota bacterium]
KLGVSPARHFGTCGGATKHFFSMWISQRRILSRRMFDNPCEQFQNLDLVYYQSGKLVFCSTPDDAPSLACLDVSHIYREAIAGPIDKIEYPPDGSPRREGHVILLRSENPELCAALHADLRSGRDFYDALTPNQPSAPDWPLGPMQSRGPFELDINNDGLPDVLAINTYGPGDIGEELILLADGRDARDIATFPKDTSRRQVAAFAALIPADQTVFAEGRSTPPYTLLRPFVWQGRTFVLYSTVFDIRPPEWAVYQISPDNTFAAICVLDRVPIHY